MKRILIIGLSLVLWLGLMAIAGMARGQGLKPGSGMGPGYGPPEGPFVTGQPKNACRMDPSITFTEEQAEKLMHLQRTYLEKAKPLWSEMRGLRIELRFAVSDPQVQPQALLEKQRKFIALKARLEDLSFSYRVKIRAIFTQEQFERFPADCPLKMGPGFGMGKGMGKGPHKGIR
ncbi:MAG: Spy/CpxP family protein refolding chaperone [Planctomycetaceae bacterium]